MSDSPLFLSESVERLLYALSAAGRPQGTSGFPPAITRQNRGLLRCGQREDLTDWFRRCVKDLCHGEPDCCQLEANMAVFAYLEWNEPNTLSYANINILCAECGLDEYYVVEDGQQRAQYLRLDLDYETLGPIFAHPLPHVHAVCHEPAARFEIDELGSSNIVIDFFEFAYRHLQPDRWINWARTVWRPYFQERATEFGDTMETVLAAFRANDIELLRRFGDDIREMRRMLRARKEELVDPSRPRTRRFDLTMRKTDRDLLAFAGRG
jgi:hypothetical protein